MGDVELCRYDWESGLGIGDLAGDHAERRRLGEEARRIAVQTLDRASVLQGLKDAI